MLILIAAVYLVGCRRQQVVAVRLALGEVRDRVRSRGDRLCLERLELRERDRSQLSRDDAPQVLLEWQLVDPGDRGAAGGDTALRPAAVEPTADADDAIG